MDGGTEIQWGGEGGEKQVPEVGASMMDRGQGACFPI